MEYEDLHKFPEGHPPSPYADMPVNIFEVGEVSLPDGLEMFAVGWIESPDFTQGDVPDASIEALVAATPGKIVPDGTRGWHTCTICEAEMPQVEWNGNPVEVMGNGSYLVRSGSSVYLAPALLLHYIIDHNYQPPQEFIDATVDGEFMGVDDLEVKAAG